MAEILFLNPSSIFLFAIDEASLGGYAYPPPGISRTTSPRDLKFGTLIHLHKRAKIPPVLIRLPVWCVFYRPESKISLFCNSKSLLGKFTSNFVKMSDFMRIYDFEINFLGLVCKIHIFGWSVKYTFQLFPYLQNYKCF